MTGLSKKHIPRVSTMPQYPMVEDVVVDRDPNAEYAVVISMYEVYNDRIFDLFASSSTKVAAQKRRGLVFKSTEDSPDHKVVAGLRKVICGNLDEALMVLETGLTERRVAGTGSNATSSRSHGFFCVEVKKRYRGAIVGRWTSSTLTIVDLAGKATPQRCEDFPLTVLLQAQSVPGPQTPLELPLQKRARSTNPSCTWANACRCSLTTPTCPDPRT